MFEEQKDPKRVEPGETEYSQPPDTSSDSAPIPEQKRPAPDVEQAGTLQAADERPAAEKRPAAEDLPGSGEQGGDYISEIRQDLVSDEKTSASKSGGLIRRITGSLRRQTGPLQKQTGPLPEEPDAAPQAALPPIEIADDFLAGRLGGALASEPAPFTPDRIESWPEETPAADARPAETESLPGDEAAASPPLSAGDLTGGELPQLEADPFAALEKAAREDEQPQEEPDWMSEIRSASDELPPETGKPQGEAPKPPVRTGPFSFITGILRGSEERRRREASEEMPDDMVTGRLERSLGMTPEPQDEGAAQDSAAQPGAAEGEILPEQLLSQAAEVGETTAPAETGAVPLFALDDDLLVSEEFLPQPAAGTELPADVPGEENLLPEISPEDELLLWGESAPPISSFPNEGLTFTPEDVWGEENQPEEGAAPPAPRRATVDDLFAETFLTGIDVLPEAPQGYSQDQLLRDALEKSAVPDQPVSLDELRQVALEGYQEGEAQDAFEPDLAAFEEEPAVSAEEAAENASVMAAEAAASAAQAEVLEEWEEKEQAPEFSLRRWWSKRTGVERLLLIEAVVVALALLVAVPFFIYQISRGPAQSASLSPRPLPADLPYPTGVELPGGWSFPLDRSTFVSGRWKPAAAEWLEGTELRRVVALPWNQQTEAVFGTFESGDAILLTLSNDDMVEYSITSVERVSASDNSIFTDTSPSLIIILYQEKAAERWVVFSKP